MCITRRQWWRVGKQGEGGALIAIREPRPLSVCLNCAAAKTEAKISYQLPGTVRVRVELLIVTSRFAGSGGIPVDNIVYKVQ